MGIAKGTILTTGANGGLGSAIADQVASQPKFAEYHGLYVVRESTSAPTLKSILSKSPSHSHDIVSLDLANLDSVRQAAETINARVAAETIPPIRALILNAGFQDFGKQVWTDDGLDMTFSANYLGHWLLTLLLLKSMDKDYGRIVLVGSQSHDPYDKRNERTQAFADEKYKSIMHDQASFEAIVKGTWSSAQEDPSWRSGFRRYGASKLLSVMMIHELQRRLDRDPVLNKVCILGVDPGTMMTGLQRRASWIIRVLVFGIIYPIVAMLMPNGLVRSTQKSASQLLHAAFDSSPPLGEFPKGLYYFDTELFETSEESRDPQKRDADFHLHVYASMDPGYLDRTPMRPPPLGRRSDFINPEDRSYQLIILIAVLSTLVVLLVSLRIYARLKVTRSFGADDWLCIIATILTLSYSGIILHLLFRPGGGILGIHLWDVPISRYMDHQKGSLADSVLIRITNTTIKVAFLVFYLRLFSPVTHVRYLVWAGMALVITFCVVFVAIDVVACAPFPSENWLSPSLLERCYRIAVDLITAAVYFSLITDFYILFIPLHQVPNLGLSKKRKIGVSLIFLTGLLAAGAALTNLIIRSDRTIFDQSDYTWTIIPVYATSLIEINVGLICLSLPVVFVLFVGRFTSLSKSVSSWIKERRSPRQNAGESSSNLSPGDSATPPQLSSIPSDTSFSGMRKFIRNIYRSRAQPSAREEATLTTFDDLTSADLSYHLQLKTIQSKQTEKSRNTGQASV
ncbi:hypothetical protein DL765_003723 [Monosporascus sp. GIB2]|nr:hypothetical protein DL765_003723 [Monosporascus sp. GIB2]